MQSSVSDSRKVCEFPVGLRNRVTVSVEDYKTLKGENHSLPRSAQAPAKTELSKLIYFL